MAGMGECGRIAAGQSNGDVFTSPASTVLRNVSEQAAKSRDMCDGVEPDFKRNAGYVMDVSISS
jgi:hypothetical protein